MNNIKSKKITLKSIADEVGSSISVVSRVLRNKSTSIAISNDTKSKILNSAIEKGWRPNNNIGIIVPESVTLNDSYYLPFFAGISIQANRYNYGIFTHIYPDISSSSLDIPPFMEKKEISASIFVHETPETLKDFLKLEKIPFVTANPSAPNSENCVVLDDYQSFQEVLIYLQKQGYNEYYYISNDLNNNYTQNIAASFNDFLKSQSFNGKIIFSNNEKSHSLFIQKLSSIVKDATPQTVFIADGRFFCIKILEFFTLYKKTPLKDAGIVAPNIIAEYYTPRLPSLKAPLFEMGISSINMIKKIWSNKNQPEKSIILKAVFNK